MPITDLLCPRCRIAFKGEVSGGLPWCPGCGGNVTPSTQPDIDHGVDEIWAEIEDVFDELEEFEEA